MMSEHFSLNEELLLKSFDAPVAAPEREYLAIQMQNDPVLRRQSDHYLKIREMMHRSVPDSFGPFFAERILQQLKQRPTRKWQATARLPFETGEEHP